jgi:hypothetical protein
MLIGANKVGLPLIATENSLRWRSLREPRGNNNERFPSMLPMLTERYFRRTSDSKDDKFPLIAGHLMTLRYSRLIRGDKDERFPLMSQAALSLSSSS